MTEAFLYVDGASFGNPGPSGTGVVLIVDGETIVERSEDTGYGTNNQAEYRALLEGLAEAVQRGIHDLVVRSDSQLLVRQMLGEYKIKAKGLKGLKMEADALRERFDSVRFEHIPRERNERADELAKAGAEAAKARGVRPPQGEIFE
ncbi:MAG TPA: ribonuclease HI family protein [Actinomycetota bacterium]|nr:ribonuclease HI family protein [Actinomycetota bacterium]